ncbi:TolC family outer membrane protein [Hyphomicrobium sp. LHD-15]|uniref:TolC family outer membrane protein n=1 Tax=Hyphomicrobium sp. LHD-15 TaxID=3072142 RepID=UPI00280EA6C7|nr:TolC family outer membrane protein [Hyphomicrobium sp. LHD-15]MDQ8700048.1 TolC family outer membrane protein [Hyphomicrobium sp. LHD-15]
MVALKRNLQLSVLAALAVAGGAVMGLPTEVRSETLNQALASAYQYNPQLDAERARLRAVDEEVTRARSGFRPVITGNADVNYQNTKTRAITGTTENELKPKGYSVEAVQPIFNGFRTINSVNEQEANVRAGRETLRSVEQAVLLDAVTAFMDVVRDQAILKLRENNVNVLSRELKATQDRFAVGEVTRTDVAQAQARRAGSVSALDLAKANLKTSRATYERVVGHAPDNLVEPSGYERLVPRSLEEATRIGTSESPAVVNSLYLEQAARFGVDRIRGELLPSVQLEASYTDRFDTSVGINETEDAVVTGRLTVPIYEGGEVYARVRQQKHIHVSRLQEIEQARSETEANVVGAWSQLLAFRAQVQSDQSQVSANTTALTGVREEERVGQRTLLDVLNAELELLTSQVTLETTRRNVVVANYAVLAAIGRLDAVNIGFTSIAYDAEAHYQEVRRKPWGTSITHSDGRTEELPASDPVK